MKEGPLRGSFSLLRAARERYHERRLGIETAAVIPLESFGVTDTDCHQYVPISYQTFQQILGHHRIKPGHDVFCDFGSGMGRGIVLAAEHPFRRVIGVEMIPELHRRSLENIERARPKLVCANIELVLADATTFAVPDDLTVAFFYNPFHGTILDKVLNNIAESIRRKPRRVTFLVQVPLPGPSGFEQTVAAHAWVRQTRKYPLGGCQSACVVYEAGAVGE
jgi:precorrin-6B methylase 2